MQIPKIPQCSKCDSWSIEYEPENGKPHHGKLKCGGCGHFFVWTNKASSRFFDRLYGVKRAVLKEDM